MSGDTPDAVADILSDEQKEFLAQCEAEFANRFSEKDAEFLQIKSSPTSSPPIIDPWYNKPRRSFDWSRSRERRPYHSDRDRSYDHRRNNVGPVHNHRPRDGAHYRPY